MKIAVIGAGLSGLTAALRLQQAGHDVVVLEADARPGGRCHAVHRDGYIIDCCPELTPSSYRRWLNLIEEVGLGDELVKCPNVISMMKDGALIDIDLSNLLACAFTPVLSWRAKFKLLGGLLRLRKEIQAVPHYLLDNIALEDPHSNAEAKSLQAFGREVTENLIEPVLQPTGGVRLNKMSTLLLPYTLSDWTQLMSLRGGLESLPIKLASMLDVNYQATVKQVVSGQDDVSIEYVDASGQAAKLNADRCLITTLYDVAETIYPRFAEISNGYAQKMEYMRMCDIKLAYRKAPSSNAAMVMVPIKENPYINLISLSHNKSPDRAPEGQALFSIFTEHNAYEELAAKSDDEIETMMRHEVERLYPEIKSHFLFSLVSRHDRVTYVPDANFFHRTKELWEAVGREPRVQLGGDIFMFGGLEAAVASGERAAQRMISGS